MLIGECLVIGLYALFVQYGDLGGGAVGKLYPMFQDVHVMIFVGFGFLMTFMQRYSFSAVGFNFFIAALTIQYAILINGFFRCFFAGTWDTITVSLTTLIEADFACGAILISFGALIGKASMEQLVVMVLFELVFYAINERVGADYYLASDMGGSIFVHIFGAYFGLAVSLVLSKQSKLKANESNFGSRYTSDIFAMIGTLFLWMYWPSFNGALAEGASQHRVVVNTVLSLTNSCVAGFLLSKLLRPGHKLDMVDIQNATLAGGVAMGSASDFVVGVSGALVTGFIAGGLSVVGYVYVTPFLERKIGLHDTCGVHNLHGMPGVLGGLISGIATLFASNERWHMDIGTIFQNVDNGHSVFYQSGMQFMAVGTTLVIAIVGGLVTGTVLTQFRNPEEYGEDRSTWGIEEN